MQPFKVAVGHDTCMEGKARHFLENNLHHTKGETGVLIFIADRGISQHVSNDQWQAIVNKLTAQIKRKQTLTGMLQRIDACG